MSKSKPKHPGNGAAIDVAQDVDHEPTSGAGFNHPVFARLHAVAACIKVFPPGPGKAAGWMPDNDESDPCRHWAYFQNCDSCHGGFNTLDAAALFCPWCGAEIEKPETDARDLVVSVGRAQVIANEREKTQRMIDNAESVSHE